MLNRCIVLSLVPRRTHVQITILKRLRNNHKVDGVRTSWPSTWGSYFVCGRTLGKGHIVVVIPLKPLMTDSREILSTIFFPRSNAPYSVLVVTSIGLDRTQFTSSSTTYHVARNSPRYIFLYLLSAQLSRSQSHSTGDFFFGTGC